LARVDGLPPCEPDLFVKHVDRLQVVEHLALGWRVALLGLDKPQECSGRGPPFGYRKAEGQHAANAPLGPVPKTEEAGMSPQFDSHSHAARILDIYPVNAGPNLSHDM
jgi:hypothetical protein